MPQTLKSPFDALDIKPSAEIEVARAAYKALARKVHPDLNMGQPVEQFNSRMIELNWALEELERDLSGWRQRAGTSASQAHSTGAGQTSGGDGAFDSLAGARISFGKYWGRQFREIATVEPGYLRWMLREGAGTAIERKSAEAALAFRYQSGQHWSGKATRRPASRARRGRHSIRNTLSVVRYTLSAVLGLLAIAFLALTYFLRWLEIWR